MFVQIEISTHCNFTCFYCVGRDMAQEYMSTKQFDAIMARLPPGQHLVCLQGEGEPMLHPHFWEMVDRVRAGGHVPYTITNGSRIDPEKVAAAFPKIAVSIDTLDPIEAERIGRKKLDKVLHNLDRLIEHMGANRLVIATVDYGQPLDALKAFVRTKGIGEHMVQPLQVKADYRRRYPDQPPPQERYGNRCRYLEQPLHRTYGMDGRAYPCCYIKDPTGFESADALKASLAGGAVPPCCRGCREILIDAQRPHSTFVSVPHPRISFVVPVKGRLDQLQVTLPRLVGQADSEVIVVDYDCPDGTRDWVVSTFPAVRVVHVAHAPAFNVARARNLGAAHARGEWLCFLDADTLLESAFHNHAKSSLRAGTYATLAPDQPGQVVCLAGDFRAIGGFDETFEGWGCEDDDLLLRLSSMGRKSQPLRTGLIRMMPHDDRRRTAYYAQADKWMSLRINGMYLQIKTDLARLLGVVELPRDELRPIYEEIRRTALSNETGAPMEIRVSLPPRAYFRQPPGLSLRQEWIFRYQPDDNPP